MSSKSNCSFCGKKQGEVNKLISGPQVYICNECIDLCNEILIEEEKKDSSEKDSAKDSKRFKLSTPQKLKEALK